MKISWIISVLFSAAMLIHALSCDRTTLMDTAPGTEPDSTTSTASPPRDGLVAEWLFDGTFDDTSGNSNTGTGFGGIAFGSDRFGKSSSSSSFDGVDDYILVPDSGSLDLTTEASFSFWVNVDTGINYGVYGGPHVFCKGATYGALYADYGFITGSGANSFENADDANTPDYTSFTPPLDKATWVHIVIAFGASAISMYKNGVMIKSETTNPSFRISTEPLYIGHRYPYMNSGRFMGLVDDFRIYNRALSDSEILALFHEGGYNP